MSRKRLLLIGIIVAALFMGGELAQRRGTLFAESAPSNQNTVKKIDAQRLEGRWVRPDGGYILELREIKKDGSLKASYFNPRPINVQEAKYQFKGGEIELSVELRDVNYPGSKYTLKYDPKSDKLIGFYFQAVDRQTYQIQFERTK